MFDEFSISQPVIAFKINLNILLVSSFSCQFWFQDCLSIFGTTNQATLTSVIMTYKDHGDTFDLLYGIDCTDNSS